MSMSVRLASVNHSRVPGVSGNRRRMPGSLNAVNHRSVMAGRSSTVAGSRTRGFGVDILGFLFASWLLGLVAG